MSLGRLEGTFCPSCGALVANGLSSCPSCGMPVETPPPADPDAVPVVERPRIETEIEAAALIESAIPSAPDAAEVARQEREYEPPFRNLAVAALLALVVMGGVVVLITHPWNPLAYDERATEEADLSHVGFPGERDTLSGQDSDPDAEFEVQSADEFSFEVLSESYVSLGSLHDSLAESELSLRSTLKSDDPDARTSGASDMEELSLSISNLVDELYAIDVSSGTYVDERETLIELASWLRNWADALDSAWSIAADDPAATEEEVLAPLVAQEEDGMDAYRRLFEGAYPSSEPQGTPAEE